jgi:hypothetical protein
MFLAGIPQTVLPFQFAPRGIASHWTAGSPGRAGAVATALDFKNDPGRNASYHELHWWDASTRTFGVLQIVRGDRAAHSMNPNQPPPGQAPSERAPWTPNALVKRILGDRWGDPNAYSYGVSFAGMPADLTAAMRDRRFIECEARRTRELMARYARSLAKRPLFNHGDGQPVDRRDWGPELRGAIYALIFPEVDMKPVTLKPVQQDWHTGVGPHVASSPSAPPGGEFWTGGPELGERKWFVASVRVRTIAVTADGRWYLVAFGSEILWMHRNNLRPIAGTRIPATGFGPPP